MDSHGDRRLSATLMLTALITVGAAGGLAALFGCWQSAPQTKDAPRSTALLSLCSKPLPETLFRGWPAGKKPDVVLVLTGEQHSYLKFCGCSPIQIGGFERRYNFMAKLQAMGWPVAAVDLGDLVKRHTGTIQQQTELKYKTSMEALEILNYTGVGVGEHDFNLPLIAGASLFTLQKQDAVPRILAANLLNKLQQFPMNAQRAMVGDHEIITPGGGAPKIGVVSIVGPSVQKNVFDPSLKFAPQNVAVLNAALQAFTAGKAEFRVLLYQGTLQEAKACAQVVPGFHVIQCLSPEEEPPQKTEVVGDTQIVMVGHRARYVGVIGAFRGKQGFDVHYQLVSMGDEYETDPAKENQHPILKLLDEYAKEVRDSGFRHRATKNPHPMQQPFPKDKIHYVGSAVCKNCHGIDDGIWANSKHSHAFDAIEKVANKPKLRQFDPECILCHVNGYQFEGGYVDELKSAHLKHVGCEACHGPGSLHVSDMQNNVKNPASTKFLSPWKNSANGLYELNAQGNPVLQNGKPKYNPQVLIAIDQMCQKCHDAENDPDYKFEDYWPKIDHTKAILNWQAVGGNNPPPAANKPPVP